MKNKAPLNRINNIDLNQWLEILDSNSISISKKQISKKFEAEKSDLALSGSKITLSMGNLPNQLNKVTFESILSTLQMTLKSSNFSISFDSNALNEEVASWTKNYNANFNYFNSALTLNDSKKHSQKTIGINISASSKNVELLIFSQTGKDISFSQQAKFNENFNPSNKLTSKTNSQTIVKVKQQKKISDIELTKKGVAVVATSDASYKNLLIFRKTSKLSFDIILDTDSSTSDMKNISIYRKAIKPLFTKYDTVLAVGREYKKVNLSYKTNNTWKTLNSQELMLLVMSLNPKKSFDSKLKSHSIVKKISKQGFKDKAKHLITSDYELQISGKTSSENILNLFTEILNGERLISDEMNSIYTSDKHFYIGRQEFKNVEEKDLLKNIKALKKSKTFFNQKVQNITELEIYNDKKFFTIKTKNGKYYILYNSTLKSIIVEYQSSNEDKDEAFFGFREMSKDAGEVIKKKVEPNMLSKKNVIKMSLMTTFLLGLILLVFAFVLDFRDISIAMETIFTSWNNPFLYILLINLFMFPFFGALTKLFVVKSMTGRGRLIDFMMASYIFMFINAITPVFLVASGGYLWYLRKKGYHSSDVVAMFSINIIFVGAMWLILDPIFILRANSIFNTIGVSSGYLKFMPWISWAYLLLNVAFYTSISLSKTIHNWIIYLSEKALFIIGKEDRIQPINNELLFNAKRLRNNTRFFIGSGYLIFTILSIAFAGLLYSSLQSYAALNLVSEVPVTQFVDIMAIDRTIFLANQLIPIPGNVGLSEWLLSEIYGAWFNNPSLGNQAAFIKRFFAFYAPLMVSIVPFGWFLMKQKKQ